MLTDEKFVEILKSLTREDYEEVNHLLSDLKAKFNVENLKLHLDECEVDEILKLVQDRDNITCLVALAVKIVQEK